MNLTAIAIARLDAVPHMMKQIMVETSPIKMVGLRPILSDSRPHGTAKRLCEMEKVEPTRPAHLATFTSGTPKLLIISGRYGKTEVSANGSANLATAESNVLADKRNNGDRYLTLPCLWHLSPFERYADYLMSYLCRSSRQTSHGFIVAILLPRVRVGFT